MTVTSLRCLVQVYDLVEGQAHVPTNSRLFLLLHITRHNTELFTEAFRKVGNAAEPDGRGKLRDGSRVGPYRFEGSCFMDSSLSQYHQLFQLTLLPAHQPIEIDAAGEISSVEPHLVVLSPLGNGIKKRRELLSDHVIDFE